MNNYQILKEPSKLMFKRTQKSFLIHLFISIINVIIIAIPIPSIVFFTIKKKVEIDATYCVVIFTSILVYFIFFWSNIFERKVITIEKENNFLIINRKHRIEKQKIISIIISVYISAEVPFGDSKIEIATESGKVLLANGLKESDVSEFKLAIQNFFDISNLNFENKTY